MQRGFCRFRRLSPFLLIFAAEDGDHPQRHGAVLLAIHLDVSFEVPEEGGKLPVELPVQVPQEAAKEIRDEVFASEGKGGRGDVELVPVKEREGVGDKGPRLEPECPR